jgi:predicted peroxiredoxin
MEERLDLELLRGAIDIHVHSYPDLFKRFSTEEIARNARDMGMRAIVFKHHHLPTVDRAYYVMQNIKGIDLFPSITLNYAVGGINPFAVEFALKMGAKIIWMPTIDSAKQKEVFGTLGGYGGQQSFALPAFYRETEGIYLLDKNGKIKPELAQVIELAAKAKAAIGVGHSSVPEMKALVRSAVQAGVKIFVDHPHEEFSGLAKVEDQREFIKEGALLNYTFSEISPKWWCISHEAFTEQIRQIGAEHIILSTDLGQMHNPLPAEGFRIMIQILLEGGIRPEDIRKMVQENPSRLLYGI